MVIKLPFRRMKMYIMLFDDGNISSKVLWPK